jgi:hypothetical protein
MYAIIDRVNYTDQAMGVLFVDAQYFGRGTFGYTTYGGIGIEQFIPADQAYVKNWLAQHAPGKVKPFAFTPGGTYVAVFPHITGSHLPSPYLLDLSGVLKGKTVSSVSMLSELLCTDGTLATWGNNTWGQLGNGQMGVDQWSSAPVLVDTSGALKGKKVVALDGGALCDDGTYYVWGSKHDVPLAIVSDVLQQKKITRIVGGWYFCDDGTMLKCGFNFSKGKAIGTPTPVLDQGVLKGKTVLSITDIAPRVETGRILTSGHEYVAVCSDGSLAHWADPDPVPNLTGKPSPPTSASALAFPSGMAALKALSLAPASNWPAPYSFPDTLGVLHGKTITTLGGTGYAILALCSDGTLVAWARRSAIPQVWLDEHPQIARDDALGWTPTDAMIKQARDIAGPNSQIASALGTAGVDYPVVVSNTGAIEGKKITRLESGIIVCADGTLAQWTGKDAPYLFDQKGVLRGMNILQVSANIVLFQVPDPTKNPADTTADAPTSSTLAPPLPQ